jgi:hypothetical protein
MKIAPAEIACDVAAPAFIDTLASKKFEMCRPVRSDDLTIELGLATSRPLSDQVCLVVIAADATGQIEVDSVTRITIVGPTV